MRLDDLPWPASATGIGALLMTDPSLPRDRFDHPYQPSFWFDEDSRPTGMVVDGDGHVVAWESNIAGDPDASDVATCQRVPTEVEQAAWDWWNDQRDA